MMWRVVTQEKQTSFESGDRGGEEVVKQERNSHGGRCHLVNNYGDSGQGMMQYLHAGLISTTKKLFIHPKLFTMVVLLVLLVCHLWIALYQQQPVQASK